MYPLEGEMVVAHTFNQNIRDVLMAVPKGYYGETISRWELF